VSGKFYKPDCDERMPFFTQRSASIMMPKRGKLSLPKAEARGAVTRRIERLWIAAALLVEGAAIGLLFLLKANI
jgi:hypothetical protein